MRLAGFFVFAVAVILLPILFPDNYFVTVVGIAAGAWLDTTLTTRNVLFTGGSCFASGSVLYGLTHPAPIGPLQANPVNNNG